MIYVYEMESVAVFIDCENIYCNTIEKNDCQLIMKKLEEYGTIHIKNGYFDLTYNHDNNCNKRWQKMNLECGIMNIQVDKLIKKNSCDIRMICDIMKILDEKPYIETYVIVSSDSDFKHVIVALREKGKRVIGVGYEIDTSQLLIPFFDEYIILERLVGEKKIDGRKGKKKIELK